MSLFTKLGNEIASPVDAAGNPRPVENADMQRWMTEVERATLAFQAGGGIIFPDKATMDGTLTYAANQMAWVMGDTVPANNGIYRKVGASGSGSWVRMGDLPFAFIMATNAGAGTPDAIVATSSLPVPAADGAALISVNIVSDNTTAPVTVAFNGGAPLTIKTMSGNDVAPGGLTAGMIVTGFKAGSTFRMITDQASAAIQAAAEAAQAAAEAAQAAAEGAAAGVHLPIIGSGDAGKQLIVKHDETGYELTDNSMLKDTYDPTNVAADVFNSANIRFLHSGAGAASRNVRDKLRDIVDIRDYGAKCDGVTDDLAAIQAALAAHPTGVIMFPAGKTVNISAAIVINTGAPTLCSEGAFPAVIRTTSLTDDIIRIACGSQILSNIGVHNLRFDATAAKTAGAGLAITSNSGYALYHGKFHDLQMSNKMHTGISCISGGFYNFFERIFINGVAPNSQGIRFQGSGSGSPWANVYMHDIAVINGRSNAGGTNTIGWLISNYCEGVYAARVSLESAALNLGLYVGGTQVRHLWFNTLIVDDTDGTGITVTTASVIRFTDCWTTSTEGNGIVITNGYDIEIKGHVAISNALSGIKIDGGSLIRIIGGNVAGNSRSPTNSAVGAYIAAGVSDWMIRDVMFDKSGADVKTHYADIFVVSGGSDRYSITGCHLFGGATTPLSDGGSGSNKNVAGNISG